MGSDETLDSEDSQLNLLLLGTDGLAQELEKEIQVCKEFGVYCVCLICEVDIEFS